MDKRTTKNEHFVVDLILLIIIEVQLRIHQVEKRNPIEAEGRLYSELALHFNKILSEFHSKSIKNRTMLDLLANKLVHDMTL